MKFIRILMISLNLLTIFLQSFLVLTKNEIKKTFKKIKESRLNHEPCTQCSFTKPKNYANRDSYNKITFKCPQSKYEDCYYCNTGTYGCDIGCYRIVGNTSAPCLKDSNFDPLKPYIFNYEINKVNENKVVINNKIPETPRNSNQGNHKNVDNIKLINIRK